MIPVALASFNEDERLAKGILGFKIGAHASPTLFSESEKNNRGAMVGGKRARNLRNGVSHFPKASKLHLFEQIYRAVSEHTIVFSKHAWM